VGRGSLLCLCRRDFCSVQSDRPVSARLQRAVFTSSELTKDNELISPSTTSVSIILYTSPSVHAKNRPTHLKKRLMRHWTLGRKASLALAVSTTNVSSYRGRLFQCLNCRMVGEGWTPNCFLNRPNTLSDYALGGSAVYCMHRIYITILVGLRSSKSSSPS